VLAALRATPQDITFVDDSTSNTRAARALGMRAITWHHRQGLARLRRQVAPQP
jgi:FMN phosphatase YigB (HAD superfamily)